MSKNRVERLESTVAELESTVEGLTEELVEAKERIRVLEAALDAETPTRVPERRAGEADEADEADEVAESLEAEPDDVAEATAEAHKGDERHEEDEEESGVDDIIVA
ncbi:DUF7518 family protein [Salinilacihabitans rarus]|uniref:DUF7518 family protein n=1 Tax=Salinilacihabitans rarus TaxID=2961596 RepID=UPI0020C8E3E3|nr:hypothetical protein [Salinilacihabitans rarus]